MPVALAIDLGGTKVEAALVDANGAILPNSRHRAPTSAAAHDEYALVTAVNTVIAGCRSHSEWWRVSRVGIGSAGTVDTSRGTISPINLPAVREFELKTLVRRASSINDVTLRSDGICITLAEHWLGTAEGVRNAIVLVVSTGVGGGIISDGRLVSGRSQNAGHLGQVLIQEPGEQLVLSTVEGMASGPRSVHWARARGWNGTSGEDLAMSYRQRDAIAEAAVARSARAVGLGIVNASTLLDLELAVIGGGFASVAPDYLSKIEDAILHNTVNDYARHIKVRPPKLANDAPLIGAAALVYRRGML